MQENKNRIEKLMKMATMASILVALSIISIKMAVWLLTDSLSLLSSLIDSVMDVAASVVSFMAVRYSLQPADEDHRFGHGKAEDIAAFAQSTFIAGSGVFILVEAVGRVVNPRPMDHELLGIVVMLVSMALTGVLLTFQSYVVRMTNSTAIKADSMHYRVDLLVNAMVIVTFVLSLWKGWHLADPLMAVCIALYILRGAYHVGREAFDKLMDKEFSDEERQRILKIILENKEINGVHDLRTRSSGLKPFIQFHLELAGDLTLKEAHRISDDVENALLRHYPHAEILIHQDTEENENISPQLGRVIPVR